MIDLRLPKITAETTEEKVAQIQSFLYQHMEELNWALGTLDKNPYTDEKVAEVTEQSLGIMTQVNRLGKKTSEISQDIDGVKIEVSDISTEVGGNTQKISTLEVTAEGIGARVSNIEKDYATSADITASANQIKIEVASTYQPKGDYASEQWVKNQSYITATDSAITSKVSYSDYTGANMVSLINQSADSIKILAKHIDIAGAVSFSSFDADTQKLINDIDGEASSASSAASAAQSTANTANATANAIATNIYMPNKTTINGAMIETGTVTANKIEVKDTSGRTLFLADGMSNTKTVNIANFKVDNNSIYSGSWGTTKSTSPTVFMCTGSTGIGYEIGGSSAVTGWCFGANGKFGVRNNGEVWANDIHITGGALQISGTRTGYGSTTTYINNGYIDVSGQGAMVNVRYDYKDASGRELREYAYMSRSGFATNGNIDINSGGLVISADGATKGGSQVLTIGNNLAIDFKVAPTVNGNPIGGGSTVTWSTLSGKPSTFPPDAHTHPKSQITDFPTSLPANGSGYVSELLGVQNNSSYTPYGHSDGNIIRAVWNVKGDERWYLKAGSYNCRVNYADSAGSASSASSATYVGGYDSSRLLKGDGWWVNGTAHDADTLQNSIVFAYSTHSHTATTGALVSFDYGVTYANAYALQLQGGYSANTLHFRNRNGDNGAWGAWKTVSTSGHTHPYFSGVGINGNTLTFSRADGSTSATVTIPSSGGGTVSLAWTKSPLALARGAASTTVSIVGKSELLIKGRTRSNDSWQTFLIPISDLSTTAQEYALVNGKGTSTLLYCVFSLALNSANTTVIVTHKSSSSDSTAYLDAAFTR